jgi:hypothetical protein
MGVQARAARVVDRFREWYLDSVLPLPSPELDDLSRDQRLAYRQARGYEKRVFGDVEPERTRDLATTTIESLESVANNRANYNIVNLEADVYANFHQYYHDEDEPPSTQEALEIIKESHEVDEPAHNTGNYVSERDVRDFIRCIAGAYELRFERFPQRGPGSDEVPIGAFYADDLDSEDPDKAITPLIGGDL